MLTDHLLRRLGLRPGRPSRGERGCKVPGSDACNDSVAFPSSALLPPMCFTPARSTKAPGLPSLRPRCRGRGGPAPPGGQALADRARAANLRLEAERPPRGSTRRPSRVGLAMLPGAGPQRQIQVLVCVPARAVQSASACRRSRSSTATRNCSSRLMRSAPTSTGHRDRPSCAARRRSRRRPGSRQRRPSRRRR